jgi:2-oxoglutarate ferredoxin oxidoreductase subunit beta
MSTTTAKNGGGLGLTRKDFQSDQVVRWCPGCGDYAILAQMQKVLPTLEIPREKFVFISGIGCAARFPYYMDTFGFHTIHGRAPAFATGVKVSNPDLSVWVISGDGDALSIGGNHLIHSMRRNVGVKIILFNNRVYGLTKGQYSPTSLLGSRTKSTPTGSVDYPLHPLTLALGAECSFVARTTDRDQKHMASMFEEMISSSLSRPRRNRASTKSSRYCWGMWTSWASAPMTTMLAARLLPVERARESMARPNDRGSVMVKSSAL